MYFNTLQQGKAWISFMILLHLFYAEGNRRIFFDWTQNFEGNWNDKFVGWIGNQPDCGQFNYEFWCRFDKPTPQKINWKILNRISILIWKLRNIFWSISQRFGSKFSFYGTWYINNIFYIYMSSSFKHVIYLNIHDNIINNSNHVCA